AAVTLALAAPWVLAALGGQTAGMRRSTPGEPAIDRVHLGHHEGLDGALLVLDAIVLGPAALGRAHRWCLGLMAGYGLAVAAQDAWYEQVVKRGWSARRLPDVTRPRPSAAWAGLLAAAPLMARLVAR